MNAPLPLSQSPEFERTLRLTGRAPVRLADGTLVLQRRILGIPVALASRFLAPTQSVIHAMAAQGLSGHVTLLMPERGPAPGLRLRAPVTRAMRDLTADDLRKELHQKWRNRLNRAERQGLEVRHSKMPQDPNHWLFTADHAQQRHRGYRNWPPALTLAYIKANPGKAHLFEAYRGTTPVAAMLFLRHANSATYHIGVQTPHGASTSSHNLLMWTAMTYMRAKGCKSLDLGTVSETSAGLTRFKIGTGARKVEIGATYLSLPRIQNSGTRTSGRDKTLSKSFPKSF